MSVLKVVVPTNIVSMHNVKNCEQKEGKHFKESRLLEKERDRGKRERERGKETEWER